MFILCLVVGFGLRVHALGAVPHGIYHDEAYYGLDALSVLEGARPIFFTANNGREPLYIYILSLSVGAFGRTPFGLRLASAMIGTLTMPVTYLLGRALFNRRVGLLAMLTCAVAFWPVALSRISFRAGALPLFLGLGIAFGWLGTRRRSVPLLLAGGIAYGLSFNTYTAARVTPLAFIAFAVYWMARHGLPHRTVINLGRWPVREAAIFIASAAVVVAPLAGYAAAHPDQVFAREGQVSIFETEGGANPLSALTKHTALALGMFGWRGDMIARHNLPGRAVFDAWTFAAFLAGAAVALYRSRRQAGAAFVLIWSAIALLPTIFAEDTPHFLRAVALLPVLWLIPGLGFSALLHWRPARWAYALVGLSFALSALATGRDYFFLYAPSPLTGYYFESAAADLAAEINSRPGYASRIDSRLWDNFASLRFLISNRDGSTSADHVQLAAWPYEAEEVERAVAALPPRSLISARQGPLARGDSEETPYSLYTLYIAEPAPSESVRAVFGGLIELRAAEVIESGADFTVRLHWAAAGGGTIDQDYHVYVHVLSGGEIVSQADGEPLNGLYPFSWLRSGDVLNDEYTLLKGEQVIVGLYAPDGTALGQPLVLK